MEDSSKTRGEFENVDKVEMVNISKTRISLLTNFTIIHKVETNRLDQNVVSSAVYIICSIKLNSIKCLILSLKVEKFELGKEEYSKRTDTVQVSLSRYPPHGDKLSFHCAQSPHI